MSTDTHNPLEGAAPRAAGNPATQIRDRQERSAPPLTSRREVMDTLLGQNNLAAFDASGADPYNATGRHFRR